MDRQSRAFREAGIDDITDDAQLSMMIDNGELTVSPDVAMPPEYYEVTEWDVGREGPKSLNTAKWALSRRVANPMAPDDDARAYDGLE
jgi:hypothetical protein